MIDDHTTEDVVVIDDEEDPWGGATDKATPVKMIPVED